MKARCWWVFFNQGFFSRIHGHWRVAGQQEKARQYLLFHSTTSTHPTNIPTFILQLCPWDNYHIFLIVPLVLTKLLLNEIHHIIELLFDWLMMFYWFLFVYLLVWFKVFVTAIWHWKLVDSNLHRLSSTITIEPTNQVLLLSDIIKNGYFLINIFTVECFFPVKFTSSSLD